MLLAEAARLNATDLHRTGRHLATVVDPDRAERDTEKALDREDRAAHLGRHLTVTEDGCGGIRFKGAGSLEDGAILRAALLPLTKPVPQADPVTCAEQPDPRDHGARMWDALVQLAQHALDTDRPPTSHGARPRVAVTIDAHTLTGDPDGHAAGVGVTDDGLELSGSAVRRLACDSDLIRVLLDADGSILDVGRTQRLVTPAIWTALVARDHHCAFPGCTRPPLMCHAHHIRHWTHGGPPPSNRLLWGHHHRTLHHTPRPPRPRPTRPSSSHPPPDNPTHLDPTPTPPRVAHPSQATQGLHEPPLRTGRSSKLTDPTEHRTAPT